MKPLACVKCGKPTEKNLPQDLEQHPWCKKCMQELGQRVLLRRRRHQRGEPSAHTQQLQANITTEKQNITDLIQLAPLSMQQLKEKTPNIAGRTLYRRVQDLLTEEIIKKVGAGTQTKYTTNEPPQ